MKSKKWINGILMASLLTMPMMSVSAATTTTTEQYSLHFDTSNYTNKTAAVDGKTISYRAYEKIVYVKNPVDTKYEIINIYVPEQYYNNQVIGNYTKDTAPIFLPNAIGGYMPAEPDSPGQGRDGKANAALVALSKGYVVASPGARGRTTQDTEGQYTGKAPAAIVDLKAAVRYLRYNDDTMPGDAEKIISNGTSAGGAMSSLLGATGNNADYEPYLEAIGAANERDDVFAVSAYTPITNLDYANQAYEWQFAGVNTYSKLEISTDTDYNMQRKMVEGTLTEDQIQVSKDLSSLFPTYVNSLHLKDEKGNLLTLDAEGEGTFKTYIKSLVIASAQKALDSGTDLSDKTWITIQNGKVTDINYNQYIAYLGRMKTPGAFDALDLSAGENQLFGTATTDKQHFTTYGLEHSTVANSTIADDNIIKMMNPMDYIDTEGTDTAPHWRIRFGTKDSDTSTAISTILATTLQNKGYSVDFALPWDVPHSGDYDLDDLFAWMATLSTTSATTKSTDTIASVTATPVQSAMTINGNTIQVNAYNIKGNHYIPLQQLAVALSGTNKQFAMSSDPTNHTIQLTSGQTYTVADNTLYSSINTNSVKATATDSTLDIDSKEVSMTTYTIND